MAPEALTYIGLLLSGLGAGEALRRGYTGARAMHGEWERRRQTAASPLPFYFRRRTSGLRVVVPDQEYIHCREAELVARRDGVTRMLWGLCPAGEVTVLSEELACENGSISVSHVDGGRAVDTSPGWDRRYVEFSRPLMRGESVRFSHVARLAVTGKPLDHFLRWQTSTRCDQARLQVAFAHNPPASVRFAAYALNGEEKEWCEVPMDPTTCSFTKIVDRPVINRYYKLSW